jgi:peptidase C25-like protein
VTGAPASTLIGVEPVDVRSLSGYLVWPAPIPAQIHDGTPSTFLRDEATYASTADYPAGDGYGAPTRATLGGIPASRGTAYPVHWNPAAGTLTVAAYARYGFGHPGTPGTPLALTIERAAAAAAALLNWNTIQSGVSVNWTQFTGNYLIVCPSAWNADLLPFIQEKKTRGFAVTLKNVAPSGTTCAQLQQIIDAWYAGTPPGNDHYCLLVGSTGATPYCLDANGQLSDKVLSSVDGDGEPEIFLGRLWVSTQAELQNQVSKILDYETGPQVNNDGHVLLVAHHQQDQDFDFASYQEAVRTASYAQVTPTFATCYGTSSSLGNGDITAAIAGGVGAVAYIGHGEPGSWLHWSASSQSYANADAAALTNGSLTPVVWSIACQTADPRQSLSLANGFMKDTQGGGVAFYGAVDQTYGSIVTVLEDSLFEAVYGRGVTRHGLAIALAEHATVVADSLFGFDAAYKYLLYGDPDMEVKRHDAGGPWIPIQITAPLTLFAPCPGATCCPSCPEPVVDVLVHDAAGTPIPGVKVAIWKPRFGGGDEILDNRYSGADGWAHIPAGGLTAGTLYAGWDDGDGRAGLDSIAVLASTSGVDPEAAVHPVRLVAAPSVTRAGSRLSFGRALGRPARVRLFGVDGRLVRDLSAPTGAKWVDWDGRDRAGRVAAQGVYVARLESDEAAIPRRAEARIVVVR